MSIICTKRFSSNRFSWNGHTISTEASDLQPLSAGSMFAPIYDDACDVGFQIVSDKTSRVATFYLSHTERDREGDIQVWTLRPIPETEREMPQLKGSVINIFND
jgi:hypothetical protein